MENFTIPIWWQIEEERENIDETRVKESIEGEK
jgi:hypothetical protein